MKRKTKQKLIRDHVAAYKGRRAKRPEGMVIAEFIETYLSSRKLQPIQKQIIQWMANGEKLIIWHPNGRNVMAQLLDERVVVKPYKPEKRKLIVALDESGTLPDDFFEDKQDLLLYAVQKTDVGDNPFYADWIEAKRKEWGENSPMWEDYITGHWPADSFGVDYAQGKDKNVIIKSLPKEDAK